MASDSDEVRAIINQYQAAWNTLDVDGLFALWDQKEDEIYYLAEEMDDPFRNLAQVKDYWSATSNIIDRLKVSLSDIHCRLLDESIAIATFRMHVDAVMKGFSVQGFKPIGSDVKVSIVLRKRNNAWRFVHYMEAHLGALPFMRRIYNNNVRSDFE